MLCVRCGEREAEKVVLIEAGPHDSVPRTSPEERLRRAEELSQLCEHCLLEVALPAEARQFVKSHLNKQRRVRAAATAEPASDALLPLLDAAETEALRNPPEVTALRQRLINLLEHLVSREGRALPNLHATSERFASASNWSHVPAPYNEILEALSGPTMEAVWLPSSPWAKDLLPEHLLARLQRSV